MKDRLRNGMVIVILVLGCSIVSSVVVWRMCIKTEDKQVIQKKTNEFILMTMYENGYMQAVLDLMKNREMVTWKAEKYREYIRKQAKKEINDLKGTIFGK